MRLRKLSSMVLILLFAAFSTMGIFSSGAADGQTAADVKITWWSPTWNEPRGDELAQAFMDENPGVTIDVQKTVGQGLQDKILIALQSGAAPDLVDTQIPWVVPYSFTGFVQDLSGYIAESDSLNPDNFFEGVWNAVVSDGKVFGIPHRSESHAFIYNKQMYREAGLDPESAPADWNELLSYSQKLTDSAKGQYGIGIVGGGEIGNMVYNLLPWIWANGGDILSADYSRITINEAPAVEAVKFYTDLLVKYSVTPPSTVQNGGDRNRDLFAEDVVAQFQAGSYVIKPIKTVDPDKEMGFGLIPPPAGKKPAALLGGWAYVIPSSSKQKDTAWKFVEFLALDDNMAYYTDTFPPTSTAMENPKFSNPDFEKFIEMLPYTRATPPIPGWTQMTSIFQKEIQAIMIGQKTAQKAMDDAAEAMKDLL